ncbi:MAG TPA: hypothetical protein VE265_11450, partial [Actinomycetota bacterium]|nr:hypothetical protein [Actinomycetota bacterium]
PRVRMGVHAGPAYPRDGNYFGATLNRAARLMSAAHGGQVVVSGEVAAVLAADPGVPVRLRDLGVHRLKDVAEPLAVWQLVLDDLPADFPPLATADASRVAVPRARTRFVGREHEQDTLATWLEGPALVTIVAAGGTGKTRLAYETALACAGRFPDGVVTVELADGGPAEVLPRALEAVLGDEPLARVERVADPIGALIDHLADRRTLLVLDNCEHVIDDARALVTALCRSCPESSILASSREPLGVDGERVLRLGPLLPGPAVDLFCDRASAAGRTFAVDELVAVRRICEQVEGLPLGIELAASRTSILSPTQIAERLATDIGILRERHSARPGRHHSLEATIAWSYELLDDDEQRLLEALSSFVGGADLHAAEAVGSQVVGDDVLDLLESLVDRCLVGTELVGREVRFRLPVAVRRFAQSRLRERREVDAVEKAHFDHYLALARSAVPAIDVEASPAMVERLTAEHENFLVAIERSLAGGRTGPAARLALALHTYWEETGHLAEGARALARVVAADPTDPGAVAALGVLVPYEAMCGQLASATERAEVLAGGLGVGLPPLVEARIRFALGFVNGAAGAWGEAARTWSRAVDDATDVDPTFARQVAWSMAYAALVDDDPDTACGCLERARALPPPVQRWFEPMGDVVEEVARIARGEDRATEVQAALATVDAMGLRFRAVLADAAGSLGLYAVGDETAAAAWWRRGLGLARDMGHLWGCWVMLELAAWTVAIDEPERAGRLWGAIDRFADQRGYQPWPLVARVGVGRREAAAAALGDAYAPALAEGGRAPFSEIVDLAMAESGVRT